MTDCPVCGKDDSIVLADGRRQCRQCRKKFTSKRKTGRLPKEAYMEMARLFWRMMPVREGGSLLHLNEKTMKRYYDLIRRKIAVRGELANARAALPVEGNRVPVFGFNCRSDTVSVVFPALKREENRAMQPDYVVYTEGTKGSQTLNLDDMRCRPVAARNNNPDFWIFAKKHLAHYRGRFRANLPLYVREMEFRYNNRGNPAAVDLLVELLDDAPQEQKNL